jgi:hypothetical protein
MGQIHKDKFRTLHIPYIPEFLDNTKDNTEDINNSLGMGILYYIILYLIN